MEELFDFDNEQAEDSKPVFDFRNDYYKIIRWELVLFAKAYILQDYEQCNRALRDLYSNVQTFFTKEERETIAPRFAAMRFLLKDISQNNRRDPAFAELRYDAISRVEEELMNTKEAIMDLLKKYNMLLPMSAGRAQGFDEKSFMAQSDL